MKISIFIISNVFPILFAENVFHLCKLLVPRSTYSADAWRFWFSRFDWKQQKAAKYAFDRLVFCFLENFSFLEIITQTSRLFIPYNWGFAEAKVTLKISSSLFHQNFSAEIVREIWQRFPYFVVDGKCWIIGEYWIFSAPQNLNCWLKLIKSLNGLLQEVRAENTIPLRIYSIAQCCRCQLKVALNRTSSDQSCHAISKNICWDHSNQEKY